MDFLQCRFGRWFLLSFPLFFFLLSFPALAQDSSGVTQLANLRVSLDGGSDVIVQDSFAYVAAGYFGLVTYKIHSSGRIEEISNRSVGYRTFSLAIDGDYAYLLTDSMGICVLDISDRYHPQYLQSVEAMFGRLILANSRLYIIDENNRIYLYNVVNHINLTYVGTMNNHMSDLALYGNYLYTINYRTQSISVFNNTNPASPSLIGTIGVNGTTSSILVHNQYLYVTANIDGVRIFDLTNPSQPVEVSSVVCPGRSKKLSINGNLAYVATSDSGVFVVDISNPLSPVSIGRNNTPATSVSSYPNGTFLYATDRLMTVDFSTVATPVETRLAYRYGTTRKVVIKDSLAYLASDDFGIRIFNIANPSVPTLVGEYRSLNKANDLLVAGNFAYFANSTTLRVIDISNPSNPVQVASQAISRWITGLTLSNQYLYVGTETDSIQIFNVSEPRMPTFVRKFDHWTTDLSAEGPFLYTCDGSAIHFYELLNPAAPVLVSSFYPNHLSSSTITIRDFYLYAVSPYYPMMVYDVHNVVSPTLVGTYQSTNPAYSLTLNRNYALVANLSDGVRILNISDISQPIEVGFYNTPGTAYTVTAQGDIVYVADTQFFGIYDCSQAVGVVDREPNESLPTTFQIEAAYPNPFNSTASLRYTIPERSSVKLELFDLTGRSVGTIVNWTQNPGTYSVKISGTTLASGTYFAKLTAGSNVAQKRLVLIK